VRLFILAAAIAVAIGAVPAAVAGPPQSVTFTVAEQFDPPSGVFTSDGSVVCAKGTTSNLTFASGFQSDRGLIFHVRKTITCDDGSGTFTLQLQARIGFNVGGQTFGPWVVLSGTGDGFAWVWQFGLYPLDQRRTRIVSRNLVRVPRTLGSWLFMRVIEPAAFLMTRRMLLGLKCRAEGLAATQGDRASHAA